MLAFIVPLRPRSTTWDWEDAVSKFQGCLNSLLAQSDPRFRIFCIHHDLPSELPTDPRLQFIPAPFVPPKGSPRSALRDVAQKRAFGISQVDSQFTHFMMVDSDDLVSNQLVRFVLSQPSHLGWFAREGYHWRAYRQSLTLWQNFWEFCGTSLVFPQSVATEIGSAPHPAELLHRGLSHNRAMRTLAGRVRFQPLPFPAVVYVYSKKNNLSYQRFYYWAWGWKRWKRRQAQPKALLPAISQEFQLTAPDLAMEGGSNG